MGVYMKKGKGSGVLENDEWGMEYGNDVWGTSE